MRVINVGVIGCGDISSIYLENFTSLFKNINVLAVADIDHNAAVNKAEKFGITHVCGSNEELFAMDDIEIVVILTNPASHGPLMKAALNSGKHAYCEKPLSLTLDEAKELVALAREKGLMAGCAPDTVLGSGIQTCRKLIEDGWIGKPIGVKFDSIYFGPESWHPNPAFLYHEGAGPMMDIGPYYISCLAYLLGPIRRVASFTKMTYSERPITGGPKRGGVIQVEVPTYISGILEFDSGVIGSMTMSFDGNSKSGLDVEIIGTNGTIIVPNPDTFGGAEGSIKFKKLDCELNSEEDNRPWSEIPYLHQYSGNSRGIGVADMAAAIVSGREHRVSSDFGYHVLEVMLALADPCKDGFTTIKSTYQNASPLPLSLLNGDIE